MRYALALLAAVSPALAGVQEVWWNITYVQQANPDGLQPRRVIGINGTWPPPPIDIQSTDDLVVHAYNSLDQPMTLHHHGMFFNSTSWMDGAQSISQCGVPPGQSFDYTVPISTNGQHGTYWIHSHAGGQYVDGLRAPVVIHPPQEKHSYDEEFTVVLGDWYHDEHSVLLKQFISVANPGGAEPVPDSALIYFAQNATYMGPIAGTSPDPVTAAVGFNENATLPFQPGKTYRLRIVNTSAFAMFFFWIDGHDMRIIEVDGTDVEEYPTDLVTVTVAQRYSVLVTARSDASQNWMIHANMDTDMFDTVPPALNPNITSSVTYDASKPITDLGTIDEYHDIDDMALVPLDVEPMLPSTRTIPLEVTFDTMDDGTNRAMFNGQTFVNPLVPTVMSEMSLGQNATQVEAYGPFSFVLNHLEVIDIILQNGDAGKHPFHLHGHKFQIVQRSTDYTSDDPTLNPPINETQTNPVRRDTVQVPSGEGVTLRVVADNPGAWIFHCHIEWHLQAGLAVTFIEAPLEAQARNAIPDVMYQQCAALSLPTSGNAAGHPASDLLDFAGWTLGPYQQVLGWRPKGIGAMAGCVLTAVLGMMTVTWYSLGGHISEEEMEHEARLQQEEKRRRGKFFGLYKPKN
ncbi:multicopper oxidase FET3 [Phanerochaete sordida]|uniref:Multicopper oxidase FET3 n=1 Tax=Phanerochaete sordida TaxID=48140 RepID=A0A9P3G1C8_9APHY|nr:multicopper oxidase FET3 [Phanerochaete sordida]